jgi:hypothetical protein
VQDAVALVGGYRVEERGHAGAARTGDAVGRRAVACPALAKRRAQAGRVMGPQTATASWASSAVSGAPAAGLGARRRTAASSAPTTAIAAAPRNAVE